jgi:DNA-binding CsgD family transcriptional regulator
LAQATPVPAGFKRGFVMAVFRHAEGTAQLAQGKFSEAAATLTAMGEICEANGIRSPVAFPWRSSLALALAGTERHEEALELARTELRLAERCDVDRARGVAMRALGLLEGGPAGLQRLEAAVQALERSPARLERGWACYELGGALRRANRRREARPPLDRALDIALACGAQLLARRAREQLAALGARPRSVMLTGVESLTPSERRVSRLAAEGLKNTEIAQALFVSLKTVETHLRSSYRKLDIASRGELPQTLGAPRR